MFSDYAAAGPSGGEDGKLNSDQRIDLGSPGPGVLWFTDIAATGDGIAAVSSAKLVIVSPSDSKQVRSIDFGGPRGAKLIGASIILPDEAPNRVWVYSFSSGYIGRIVTDGSRSEPDQIWKLAPFLVSLQWVETGRRLIATGLVTTDATPLLQAIDLEPRSADGPSEIVGVGRTSATMGRPLFPGMIKGFAENLNVSFASPQPSGSRIAVGYRWNDRIAVYDSKSGVLERSIAGPIVSRLSFGVGTQDRQPVFTLGEETRYSYVAMRSTENAILGIYSGTERRKAGRWFSLGNEIHAFTWDGRLVGRWKLAEGAQSVSFSKDGTKLFSLVPTPSPAVIVSPLPLRLQLTTTTAKETLSK